MMIDAVEDVVGCSVETISIVNMDNDESDCGLEEGQTDESLISSTSISVTTSKNNSSDQIAARHSIVVDEKTVAVYCSGDNLDKKSHCCCGATWKLVIGICLTVLGIGTLIKTPYDIFMEERIEMRPGFPAFEWWKDTPDELLLKVYLFNITNAEEFMNGTDNKLKLAEVGPIVYLEKLTHSNVTFNENGTLSFVAERKAIFLPELNSVDLNASLYVPNIAVLGTASYLNDRSFFLKLGFNILLNNVESKPLTKVTVYEYMWNYTDPLLQAAQKLVPFMVPTNNMGVLENIYSDFTDTITVRIGRSNGHEKFFLMDKYDGTEYLPRYSPEECTETVTNSTEGVLYTQFMTKESVPRYWRKSLCRIIPLKFKGEYKKFGLQGYKYAMLNDSFDRVFDVHDCYASDPMLPNGLSDLSKCYYDFPVAASMPHFLIVDPKIVAPLEGLQPNYTKHGSYAIVEPVTGIPLESRARSQSNLVIKKLVGFNGNLKKFSNIVIPMFWLEYVQDSLPWYILCLVYFTVYVGPIIQYILFTIPFFLGGLVLVYKGLSKRTHAYKLQNLKRTAISHIDKEKFMISIR